MSIEKSRITPFQYMLSVTCFIQSSSMLSSFFTPITRQDSWLVVIIGMVAALPVLFIYSAIMRSFPGKTLIEITQAALGRVAGTIVSLLFIWFFLSLTALNLRDFGQFVRMIILVETPVLVVVTVCMALCAYAVVKGLNVVTRYSPVFVLLFIALALTSILMTLNLMDFNNFVPMLEQQPGKYMQGTNILLSIPFGELVIFLMVTPYVKPGKRGRGVHLFGGFLIGGASLLSVVARDTAVLGSVGTLFTLPSFETLRLIHITNAISRMEILYAIVLIVLLFFKISMLYYVSVMAIAQLLSLKSYHPLVLIMGVFVLAYSYFVFPSIQVHSAFGRETVPIFWMVFEIFLPLVVLVAGRVKGLHKQAPFMQADQGKQIL